MKFFKFLSLCLTVCILSSVFTFIVTKQILSNQVKAPAKAETKTSDLYEGTLVLSVFFQKCHHTISDTTAGTVSYSSPEDLLRRYPGYTITSGESEEIVLTKTQNTFCPYHFSATLKENEITITRLYDQKQISVIKTNETFLSEQEKSLLKQGITINSKEALTSFIEDFTS